MMMLLFVFLAFCLSGFAASSKYDEVQFAVSLEPDNTCACTRYPVPQCGCCTPFLFDAKLHKLCMKLTYVKEQKGIRFTIIVDGKVVFDKIITDQNPPPFCQGVCPGACICGKYYNVSYGDNDKWGGCLEIYGDLARQFGCHYLPVNQAEQETIVDPIVGKPDQSALFNDIQQWYRNTLAKKARDRQLKKINPLHFLYKNRMEQDNLK